MEIDYEVRGDQEALIRVRAIGPQVQGQLKDLIAEAAHLAFAEMQAKVPRGTGEVGPEGTIADSIDVGEPVYHAGGAGGGGYYEVRVGPGDDAPSHLEFVLKGTGVHGPYGVPIEAPQGFPMAIEKMGEGVRFRQSSQGQEPQTEWLEDAQDIAREHVELGIHTLRIGNL